MGDREALGDCDDNNWCFCCVCKRSLLVCIDKMMLFLRTGFKTGFDAATPSATFMRRWWLFSFSRFFINGGCLLMPLAAVFKEDCGCDGCGSWRRVCGLIKDDESGSGSGG